LENQVILTRKTRKAFLIFKTARPSQLPRLCEPMPGLHFDWMFKGWSGKIKTTALLIGKKLLDLLPEIFRFGQFDAG
jgi:hypothetical protein